MSLVPPFPIPPRQSEPWALSSTNLPANLESAVAVLFRSGMADPRACEYREIEVVVGSVSKASGFAVKTHGWVLPSAREVRTNYVIGWNGLVYQAVSVGNPANAADDARAMIRAMSPPSIPEKVLFDLGVQTYTDEEYSLDIRWLTQAKAAMILRIAVPELAEECARLFPTNDPFLALATGRLWTAFDRAICAHMRGDDDLAYVTALSLTQAREICEAEAKARGFTTAQVPEANFRQSQRTSELDSYFPFLNSLPALLQDQERRHRRKTPVRDPATATLKAERIAALIDRLENVSGRQAGYALDYDLLGSPTVRALINEGWDAVEPLLQCYEHDDRLTRLVPVSFGGGGPYRSRTERKITGVRSPAYAALEGILETPQFAPAFTGKETREERLAIYKRTAAAMHDYWEKYRGLSREERLYAILKDDRGRWLEAASIIVRPTNQPVVPFISWDPVPWVSPLNPDDATPMRGESLRSKSNPSVSELMIRRINDVAARAKDKPDEGHGTVDDASDLNEACDLALCFARWDSRSALKTIQTLTDLAFVKLDPKKRSSLVSHMYLSGQLPALIALRAKAGDTNALAQYALWLKTIDPKQFSWQPRQILNPLRQFPNDPAWTEVWKFLFDDEQSQWFNFFRKISSPDPARMSTPYFAIEEFFGTPILNQASFRKFVIRLLRDESPCGKIAGGSGSYWLDQRLSTDRRFGYTVRPPDGVTEIVGRTFRTCDFYAWLLSNRIQGAPEFQLYWSEDQRDAAIPALEKMLEPNSVTFKTRPFQER